MTAENLPAMTEEQFHALERWLLAMQNIGTLGPEWALQRRAEAKALICGDAARTGAA